MRRSIRKLMVPVVLGWALVSTGHELAAADSTQGITLRRWLGAEAGWDEIACGTSAGCAGWSSPSPGVAGVGTSESNQVWPDPDGVLRPWPARTGRYFYILGVGGEFRVSKGSVPVQGPVPSQAYLSSTNSALGGFPGGTLSFAFRIHTLPEEPVVLYEHEGPDILRNLTLTLNPDGSSGGIVATALGMTAETRPIETMTWHTVVMSYGPSRDRFLLYLDGALEVDGILRAGAPQGKIALGIVTPMTTEFVIGLDDYVETSQLDAPIGGARINYLMPLGDAGIEQWDKQYPAGPCKDAARNWQLVSENQHVRVSDMGNGNAGSCGLEAGVGARLPNLVDEYRTEGIPSDHRPWGPYARDLTVHPREGDAILGVRVRMRGSIQNSVGLAETWHLGFVDQGRLVQDSFSFTYPVTQWGPTHSVRPNGHPWDLASLDAATLRLDSGSAPITHRSSTGVRLDYVWVPAA